MAPNPVTRDDIDGLREDTRSLAESVERFATKDELKLTNDQVQENGRLARRANINSVIASVAFVLVLLFGWLAWNAYNNQRSDDNAARIDRARGSCQQFNVQQKSTREGNVNLLVEGFRPFVKPGDEPKLDDFRRVLVPLAEKAWPYRDCSDIGIEQFLRNPPPDPAQGG